MQGLECTKKRYLNSTDKLFKEKRTENFPFSIYVHHNSITTIITIGKPLTKHAALYEDDKQQAQLKYLPERIQ